MTIFIRNPFDGFHSTDLESLDPNGFILSDEIHMEYWNALNGTGNYLNNQQVIIFDENNNHSLTSKIITPEEQQQQLQNEARNMFESLLKHTNPYFWNKFSPEQQTDFTKHLDDLQDIINGVDPMPLSLPIVPNFI